MSELIDRSITGVREGEATASGRLDDYFLTYSALQLSCVVVLVMAGLWGYAC